MNALIAKIVRKAFSALYILSIILCSIVILVIPLYVIPNYMNFMWAPVTRQFTQCQSNLKNIGTALEMYAHDNQGHYPPDLSHLTPKYLDSIPICTAVKKDTYSNSYQVSSDMKTFTVYCKGHHHSVVGLEKNYPQYDSIHGLTLRGHLIKSNQVKENSKR